MEFLILVVALIIHIAVTIKFSIIATEKGYDGKNYFWVCFFLGTIGFIMVAALPDQNLYYLISELQNNKASQSEKIHRITDHPSAPPSGSWQCDCGRVNANYVSSCSCGKSKRDAVK